METSAVDSDLVLFLSSLIRPEISNRANALQGKTKEKIQSVKTVTAEISIRCHISEGGGAGLR